MECHGPVNISLKSSRLFLSSIHTIILISKILFGFILVKLWWQFCL